MANNKNKDIHNKDYEDDDKAENAQDEQNKMPEAEYETDDDGINDYPDIISVTKTFLNINPDEEKKEHP